MSLLSRNQRLRASAFDWLNSIRQLTLLVPSYHQGDESLWVLCFPLSESMRLWQRGWKRNNCALIIHYSFLLFFFPDLFIIHWTLLRMFLIHYLSSCYSDFVGQLYIGAMPLHEKGDIYWDRLQSLNGCILFNSISCVDNEQELIEKRDVIKKKGYIKLNICWPFLRFSKSITSLIQTRKDFFSTWNLWKRDGAHNPGAELRFRERGSNKRLVEAGVSKEVPRACSPGKFWKFSPRKCDIQHSEEQLKVFQLLHIQLTFCVNYIYAKFILSLMIA